MPKIKIPVCIVFSLMIFSCTKPEPHRIDLAGTWSFQIDSLDVGLAEQWFSKSFDDSITLPGSMAENGKGNDITVDTEWTGNMWSDSTWYTSPEMAKYRQKGNVKVPFWLSPKKVYYGAAWYKKTVTVPEEWKGKHLSLFLERPHWETMVWVDEVKVGLQNTLGTPHTYIIDRSLSPGTHAITIRIDNRMKDIDVGKDAHSVSDNTQTNWNGVVGDIYLTALPSIRLGTAQVYPDVKNNSILIKGKVEADSPFTGTLQLSATATSNQTNASLKTLYSNVDISDNGDFELIYPMGDEPELWDEFSPLLYTLNLQLSGDKIKDEKNIVFGMREFMVKGKQFAINGRPIYLRGTLESAIFPLTGYPAMDLSAWKRILKIVKNYGLNHVRFHSWCPPEAAFTAADQLGVYLQVEASTWSTVGDGNAIDEWVYKEAEAIVENYGNHPSFVMMAYGNEPAGENHIEYLGAFVEHMKNLDTRRVYTSGAGWPFIDTMDFYNHAGGRIQGWGQELTSIINATAPQTMFDHQHIVDETPMPYVSHEMGQWCVYPNFKEMSKYNGVLQPKNFEIFKEDLEANGMGALADSLLLASGKLQVLCYKADIEAALRTKNMAGFQLLDLHDFPGQGTALVGVLDVFWDEKGYVTPAEFRRFNNITVPLARMQKRIFLNDESFEAALEVFHYGPSSIDKVLPHWKLMRKGKKPFAEGNLDPLTIPIGSGTPLGKIKVNLNTIDRPEKLTLEVSVGDNTNTWDVWVYPKHQEPIITNDQVRVVSELSPETMEYLTAGGKVLLTISKGDVKPEKGGDIGVGFSSIFWNTSWTKGQKPHTLGILTNPKHPAFSEFPTEYHSNWQWWDAMSHSNAIVLDEFTPNLQPIVRIVDDWFKNRRTALIFEVNIHRGKLLISGIDLHTDLEHRPEARQLRYSLTKYMVGNDFDPTVTLTPNEVQNLFLEHGN